MGILGKLVRIVTVREWSIGVADFKLEDLVGEAQATGVVTLHPHARWLSRPWYARVQADPCLIEHEGRHFVYWEDLYWGSLKGRLRCLELAADGTLVGRSMLMMSLSHHAAYPFVFTYLDAFYCVPETGTRNEVALYKSDSPLGPWVRHSTLLEGVSARDSTVFPFDDRWWLFCTVAGRDPLAYWADLHIWHAPEPWGPWEPHLRRPAKSDIHSARPAGRPFLVDGVLYRPSQDCAPRYGTRTVINRVVTLTPSEFVEAACCYVEPEPSGPYGEGLHTITSAGDLVLIDGGRERPTINVLKIVMMIVVKIRQRLQRAAAVS